MTPTYLVLDTEWAEQRWWSLANEQKSWLRSNGPCMGWLADAIPDNVD